MIRIAPPAFTQTVFDNSTPYSTPTVWANMQQSSNIHTCHFVSCELINNVAENGLQYAWPCLTPTALANATKPVCLYPTVKSVLSAPLLHSLAFATTSTFSGFNLYSLFGLTICLLIYNFISQSTYMFLYLHTQVTFSLCGLRIRSICLCLFIGLCYLVLL